MTWQSTASSGWKGQMLFASALLIPPFLPPSASLTWTFSQGLTLLHKQQQDHAQHITFIGNECEWANHIHCAPFPVVWWNRKYVLYISTSFVGLNVSVHLNYEKIYLKYQRTMFSKLVIKIQWNYKEDTYFSQINSACADTENVHNQEQQRKWTRMII